MCGELAESDELDDVSARISDYVGGWGRMELVRSTYNTQPGSVPGWGLVSFMVQGGKNVI